jgi:hypothetical protein
MAALSGTVDGSDCNPLTLSQDSPAPLIDALLRRVPVVAAMTREAIVGELPVYAVLEPTVLEGDLARSIECCLRSGNGGCAMIDDVKCDEPAAIGAARGRQGISVDEMLREWRIAVGMVISHAQLLSRKLGIADAAVLAFVRAVLTWSDLAMVAAGDAYRRTEVACRFAEEMRASFVRDVLLGTISGAELAIQADAHGLDPAGSYVAIRALLMPGMSRRKLEWALGFHGASQRTSGLCAVVDGCVAGFLSERPSRELDVVAGAGPALPLDEMAASYRLATRALITAQKFGMRGVQDISSVGLRAATVADTEVGKAMRTRYVGPLRDSGSAQELLTTIDAYLACGMNVERTAKQLYVHQNTVRYRLARFEELSGCDMHDVEDLFGIWWALKCR